MINPPGVTFPAPTANWGALLLTVIPIKEVAP